MYTELISQRNAIPVPGIHAQSVAVGAALTGAVDLGAVRQVMFLIDSGSLGASATLNFELVGCATAGGTYTVISGTSITPITTNAEYAIVSTTSEYINELALGYRFIKGQVTIGTATSIVSVHVIASDVPFEPAANINDASVVQRLELFRTAAADS
jgi:hypothetical protein